MNVFAFVLLMLSHSPAHANGVGNGGDPIADQFLSAKKYAVERVNQAVRCAFGVDVRSEVRDWILNHQQALAEDIAGSKHQWTTKDAASCGFTGPNSKDEIIFSYPTCRKGVTGITDAIRLVVHESVHHFGIGDESFANEVASAIATLGTNSSCSGTPASDPFDPASCPGVHLSADGLMAMIPLPRDNRKELGQFRVYARERACYSDTFCTPWEGAGRMAFYDDTPNGPYPLARLGIVEVIYQNNLPELKLTSNPYSAGNGQNRWAMRSWVRDFNLSGESWDARGRLKIAGEEIGPTRPLLGWVTESCFRQSISGSMDGTDDRYNKIRREYELVFLSYFSL